VIDVDEYVSFRTHYLQIKIRFDAFSSAIWHIIIAQVINNAKMLNNYG
jgi:hypothetical protein